MEPVNFTIQIKNMTLIINWWWKLLQIILINQLIELEFD